MSVIGSCKGYRGCHAHLLGSVPIMLYAQELLEEGKVKYVGLSECTADQIRRAHAITPITAVEIEWSLWERGNEVRYCSAHHTSFGKPTGGSPVTAIGAGWPSIREGCHGNAARMKLNASRWWMVSASGSWESCTPGVSHLSVDTSSERLSLDPDPNFKTCLHRLICSGSL